MGVPDGMGAMLYDEDTVRIIFQSESYGPIWAGESYPFIVNENGGSFTGSHVQYVDYDRTLLADFMTHGDSAYSMVKGSGNLIKTAYNLLGNYVGKRNTDSACVSNDGAHFSNTDPSGCALWDDINAAGEPQHGVDWLMQSLCSAHLEEAEQWGAGIGVQDDLSLIHI